MISDATVRPPGGRASAPESPEPLDLVRYLGVVYLLASWSLTSDLQAPLLYNLLSRAAFFLAGSLALLSPHRFLRVVGLPLLWLCLIFVLPLLLGLAVDDSSVLGAAITMASWPLAWAAKRRASGKTAWVKLLLKAIAGGCLLFGHGLGLSMALDADPVSAVFGREFFWLSLIAMFLKLAKHNRDLLAGGDHITRELLARELATRLEFGMPLPAALADLDETFRASPGLRGAAKTFALAELADSVARGDHIAQAVRARRSYPDYWPRLLELSPGPDALHTIFRQLAELENRRRPMLGFMPIFTGYFVLLIFSFLFTYPMQLFGDFLETLPPDFSNNLTQFALGMFDNGLILGLLWWGALSLALLPATRRKLTLALSDLVYPRSLGQLAESCQLFAALAGLTRLGLPLTAALEVASQGLSEARQRERLRKAAHRGAGLSDLGADFPSIFSDHVLFLIRAGERTDRLPEALDAVRTYLDEDFELERARARGHLELAALLAVGLATGIGAFTLIAAYAEIVSTVSNWETLQ